ncbi:sugar ABC transporter ATP-binding protein [Egibacter rhizosphaerae]|uniref:Sugar ABC transporter ATP-binding protein n=1 Tax=Egibacter rhizosphaerae TaxID=1670831 RepID=A0A411YGC6_9ACTN|nr:sugar ABC transporter ATP-binding protein [Egibacter rhizosphaerae]QBI20201.1 sugar ABC transporter ATP-binding protein [Egibacter rhizosphaerae]
MSEPTPLLELQGIHKRFDSTVALDGVGFSVCRGEVHGLVGENGAGKSTLVKVSAGVHQPDEGRIFIGSKATRLASPREAEAAGIALIPQELDLFGELTVAENLFVGRRRPRTAWGGIDWKTMASAAAEVFERLGLCVPPRATVGQLSTANRQLVAIARALIGDARVLFMDEPTSALSDRETERLFRIIEDLRTQGVGVVYISHRLEEVFRLADRVTVLRDGSRVITDATRQLTADGVVRHMVGRELTEHYLRSDVEPGRERLRVEGLTKKGEFRDVSFALRAGEVVGVAGLIGAGRTEFAQTIFGLRKADAGRVLLDGDEVRISGPADAFAKGIAYVPEDRQLQGLVLPFIIRHNISLSSLGQVSHAGWITPRTERSMTEQLAERLHVRGARLTDPVNHLSGGNQQKTMLARCLARDPDILLLDEPTRGIDIGAKAEIYRQIDELAKAGKSLLVISSELEEVLGLADRVLVMREGRLVADLDRAEADRERVIGLATGTVASGDSDHEDPSANAEEGVPAEEQAEAPR